MSSTVPQANQQPAPHSTNLLQALLSISQNPSPHVANPPNCPKRASVALILRIRPHSSYPPPSPPPTQPLPPASTPFTTATSSPTLSTHPQDPQPQPPPASLSPSPSPSPSSLLTTFFNHPWVLHGDPEALFIKRASRPTDRWSSHVALPGGRRDPEDEDDKATAVRETMEEIGLDLNIEGVIYVGKLPERVVSTSWGKVPIMVLSPFIFLLTTPSLPAPTLQPTEIASLHSVPLRTLLSPTLRTHEHVSVSARFAPRAPAFVQSLLSYVLGDMRFSAIRLLPAESLVCTEAEEYFPSSSSTSDPESSTTKNTKNAFPSPLDPPRPLLLWGLTLGMLADFLDQLPPHNAISLWSYPTFTAVDVRFIIHLLTRGLKARNNAVLQNPSPSDSTSNSAVSKARRRGSMNQTAIDMDSEAVAVESSGDEGDNPWFVGGLSKGMKAWSKTGSGTSTPRAGRARKGKESRPQKYAVGILMNGYYGMARRGVWITMLLRVLAVVAFGWGVVRRYRTRKSRRV